MKTKDGFSRQLATVPVPMGGLALGIASLGWCLENAAPLGGASHAASAVVAALLLAPLIGKYLFHPWLLRQEAVHSMTGAMMPAAAMCMMIIAHALASFSPFAGNALWLVAVFLHLALLSVFAGCRFHEIVTRRMELAHVAPNWQIPPIGIMVATVTCPDAAFVPLAQGLMFLGLACGVILVPLVVFRLIFAAPLPPPAQASIAILAAPASLGLSAWLTLFAPDSAWQVLTTAALFGSALMLTAIVYLSMFRLLRLPFTLGWAAMTFPMVIGASALYKMAGLLEGEGEGIRLLAHIEAGVATLIVLYVAMRFLHHYMTLEARSG